MSLLLGAVNLSGQPLALSAHVSSPSLPQANAGAALRTTYEEQRRLTWDAADKWDADSVRFFPVRFAEPHSGPEFRPLTQALPDLPGMRMTWDYEALASAGHQRAASGAAPLAALGLLLLATRRWD